MYALNVTSLADVPVEVDSVVMGADVGADEVAGASNCLHIDIRLTFGSMVNVAAAAVSPVPMIVPNRTRNIFFI